MSSPHGTSNGDHSGSLKGLDAALLQSQLVCLGYICISCCITMYRGTVRCPLPLLLALLPFWPCLPAAHPAPPHTPPTPPLPFLPPQAWHNDGWHLPMVIALAFSTYLKLKQVSGEDHSA
jgi:hypothetical protein